MYREFLNECYFKDAQYIHEMIEDLYRCEKAIEDISILKDCCGQIKIKNIEDALYWYHQDLQHSINEFMDHNYRGEFIR